MLSVPLAVTGALLSLWLTGGTLNVYSQIGMVMLIGLVTKTESSSSNLPIRFRNKGKNLGGGDRSVGPPAASDSDDIDHLGPLCRSAGIGDGSGAESRQQIGWVVVGGMTVGTVLTLFVIPTAYTFFAKKRQVAETEGVRTPPELVHADRS